MASHSESTVDISEQLPSVWHRWPVRRHLAMSTERSTHAILQKLSFGNGSMRKEKKLITGALENPRMMLSSQRRYRKHNFEEGIDHSGGGMNQGQEGSNEDETELFSGKHGIRRRFCKQQCATQHGYQVNILARCHWTSRSRSTSTPKAITTASQESRWFRKLLQILCQPNI